MAQETENIVDDPAIEEISYEQLEELIESGEIKNKIVSKLVVFWGEPKKERELKKCCFMKNGECIFSIFDETSDQMAWLLDGDLKVAFAVTEISMNDDGDYCIEVEGDNTVLYYRRSIPEEFQKIFDKAIDERFSKSVVATKTGKG